MALDNLLASQGGVCTIINTSYCMYVDQSVRISAVLQKIWEQVKLIHKVQLDNTSAGFKEVQYWVTSWIPELGAWSK